MAERMTFFRSYLEGVEGFDDATQLEILKAILRYGLYNEEPENLSPVARLAFTYARPSLEKSAHKAEVSRANGNVGGRPKKESQKEPTETQENPTKPTETQEEPKKTSDYRHKTIDNDIDNGQIYYGDKREDANASKRETVDALIQRWNGYSNRGSIPTVRSVTKDSKVWKSIFARVDAVGIDTVNEVMDMVFESDYLRGMKTDWCAKFDWVFLPSNFDKIRNGNYRNVKQSPQGFSSSQERGGYEAMMELRRRAEAERNAV